MSKDAEETKLPYAEIQDFFERTLKLITPPVAVKFTKPGEEKPKGLSTNIKPMTFCQAVTVARQGDILCILKEELYAVITHESPLDLEQKKK